MRGQIYQDGPYTYCDDFERHGEGCTCALPPAIGGRIVVRDGWPYFDPDPTPSPYRTEITQDEPTRCSFW